MYRVYCGTVCEVQVSLKNVCQHVHYYGGLSCQYCIVHFFTNHDCRCRVKERMGEDEGEVNKRREGREVDVGDTENNKNNKHSGCQGRGKMNAEMRWRLNPPKISFSHLQSGLQSFLIFLYMSKKSFISSQADTRVDDFDRVTSHLFLSDNCLILVCADYVKMS